MIAGAMVAGALLLATSAAQGTEKIELSLGGDFKVIAVGGNQGDGPGQPGGTIADQIDEAYIHAAGAFGRLKFGQKDPASDSMFYGSPWPVEGVGLASPNQVFSALGNAVGASSVISNLSNDTYKITYFTPRMSGFQLGLSYTPDNCLPPAAACASAGTGLQSRVDAGQQSETVEIGGNYIRQFSDVDLSLYAGMAKGNVEGTPAAIIAAGLEDQDQWGLGISLGYGGITFGADYREDDQGTAAPDTERTDYSVGLNYAAGNWTIGAAYAHGEIEAGTGLGQDQTDGYQVGVIYALGPGFTMTGGITYWDVGDNLNAVGIENTSTEFILGTRLSF